MKLSTENGALRALVGERKAIEIFAQAGFDALDYTFTPWMERGEMPWNTDRYKEYAKEVNQMMADNGLVFNQAHAPFIFHTSYLPDWDREIMPLQIRCFESCALLGIPHMVVHPIHHLPYTRNKAEIWELNKTYYNKLQPYAKEFGVKVSLENMFGLDERNNRYVTDMFADPNEYVKFYDELENTEDFICLVDTGHSYIVGEDAADTIRVLGSRVKGTHINDNSFIGDDHLIPFDGRIDWDDVMKALADIHYDGDITFEALHLYEGFAEDFYLTRARYLHDVGRYLISRFNKFSEEQK